MKDPDHWARQALEHGALTVADAARPAAEIREMFMAFLAVNAELLRNGA